MNSKNITILVIIIILIGGYFWLKPPKTDTPINTEEQNAVEYQQKIDIVISDFAKKYSVNTEIPKDINYSYQLESFLNKPIIFKAELSDVFFKNGNFFGRFIFKKRSSGDDELRIFYTLTGCDKKFLEIKKRSKYSWELDQYIVVAKISNISKPILKLGGSPIDESDAEIEVYTPDVFIASGTCLDFEYIENLEDSIL